MNGLGAETAKNVILGNVKGVTLHDNADVSPMDLASHFYVTEEVGTVDPANHRPTASDLRRLSLFGRMWAATGLPPA